MNTEKAQILTTPPVLELNFEELKEAVMAEAKKYDVVVDPEELPEAKRLAAMLSKRAKEFDDRRKAEITAISAPIKKFDAQMKELVELYTTTGQKLRDQIKVCQQAEVDRCLELLRDLREELWDDQDVTQEFRSAEYEDLGMISNISNGKLAKKARDAIRERVQSDRAMQDRTAGRLNAVKVACYEAGLKSALTREHVLPFLYRNDAEYSAALDRLVANELKRQEESERILREQMESEQKAKMEKQERMLREQMEKEHQEAEEKRKAAEETAAAEKAAAVSKAEDLEFSGPVKPKGGAAAALAESTMPEDVPADGEGNRTYRVVCTFVVTVPEEVTRDDILSGAQKRLQAAGMDSLKSIEVSEVPRAEDPRYKSESENLQ